MNVVDSSAWLEYFADGSNADFFSAAVENTEDLIVPVITLYEVFKRVLQQRDENAAMQAVTLTLRYKRGVKPMNKFLALFLSMFFFNGVHADEASFWSKHSLLVLPELRIDNGESLFFNLYLMLEPTGQYTIKYYSMLSEEDASLLNKLKNTPCGIRDSFGRLGALYAFLDGNKSYCLSRKTGTTEGGTVTEYLFIENGYAQYIVDSRFDLYGADQVYTRTYTNVQFAYIEDDLSLSVQTDITQIDFNRDSVLILTGEDNRSF